MSELFDQAIAEVKKLSDHDQDAAALALVEFLKERNDGGLTAEQLAEVRRRRSDPDRVLVSH